MGIFRKKPRNQQYITVVSGLPRSGTSLMQGMLKAGGIEPLTDGIRIPDKNNPKGYYEYERVKALKEGDTEWLELAQGKSIKIISWLLEYVPSKFDYRILFMQRNMDEILASQKKMLVDREEPTDRVSDQQLAQLYSKHLDKISSWLLEQRNIKVLYIDYNELVLNPSPNLSRINKFFDGCLIVEKMAKEIDANLYRQRKN